jgi:hypothetical protein
MEEPLQKVRVITNQNRSMLFAGRFTLLSLLLCVAVVRGWSQSGRLSPNPGEEDGISAGGSWLEFHSEDKMTGEKRVRFLLVANNYFREDQDFKPRVQLFCSAGKMTLGDFNPGTHLARPDRPGFWGQPQMQVRVRIDDFHTQRGWNWINGHFLAMDKGTVRGLIGAHIFNVELRTRSGWQIAEFSPAGLRLDRVQQACGLTPKNPSSD